MLQGIKRGLLATVLCLGCANSEPPANERDAAPSTAPAAAATVAIGDSTFGVVAPRDSLFCLHTVSQTLPRGSIYVVYPRQQTAARTHVLIEDSSCVGEDTDPARQHWRVAAAGLIPGELGIAILAPGITPPTGASTDIDGDGSLESYRVCTSSEGMHLTVWTGESVRRRLWHDYHYLGYDVDATCGEADYATQ